MYTWFLLYKVLWFKIIVRVSVVYKFRTENNKTAFRICKSNSKTLAMLTHNSGVIPWNEYCSRESNCMYFGFWKQSFVIKMHHHYKTQEGKIHLQIMLSDIAQSNFKRIVVFCSKKRSWKTKHFEMKELIESRKHFIKAYKNQLAKLLYY